MRVLPHTHTRSHSLTHSLAAASHSLSCTHVHTRATGSSNTCALCPTAQQKKRLQKHKTHAHAQYNNLGSAIWRASGNRYREKAGSKKHNNRTHQTHHQRNGEVLQDGGGKVENLQPPKILYQSPNAAEPHTKKTHTHTAPQHQHAHRTHICPRARKKPHFRREIEIFHRQVTPGPN